MLHINKQLSQSNQILWKSICNNIYKNMKKDLKHKIHIHKILRVIKTMYKITPARLKANSSQNISHIVDFALYLLVKYSNLTLQDIANEFENITINKLTNIQTNSILHIKYQKDEIIFLNHFKEGYLSDKYQSLVFKNIINKFEQEI
jgi:hypothetical protein